MPKVVLRILIAAITGFALLVNSAAAQTEIADPDLDAYWELVTESDRLYSVGSPSEAAVRALAADWQAVVDQFNQERGLDQLQIHPQYILNQLERSPRNDERLAELFAALKVVQEFEAARIPANQFGDPYATLDDIIAANDLRETADGDGESDNQIARFFERIDEILYGTTLTIGLFSVNLFGLVGIILFGFVIAFILRSLISDFVTNAAIKELEDEDGVPLTAESALKQAGATAEAGDYRSAVRFLYLSTLLSLEEQSLLRYDRSLTNREYLRQLQGEPQLAALLKDVVEVFDQVWYGFAPIDDKTFQTYADRIAHLQKNKGGL